MMELEELFEKLKGKFQEKQHTIDAQANNINSLEVERSSLLRTISQRDGQIMELNGKLKKFHEAMKGVDLK